VKTVVPVGIVVAFGLAPSYAFAAPSAEIAKRCIHYSYLVYPYKRPGSVRMSDGAER
jgi:hypothetical protein